MTMYLYPVTSHKLFICLCFALFVVKLLGKHDGRLFDDRTIKFPLGEGCEFNVVDGIEMALKKMKKSQQTRLKIAPDYGWGQEGYEEFGIPPDATITYEVTLVDYVKVYTHLMQHCVAVLISAVKRILGV